MTVYEVPIPLEEAEKRAKPGLYKAQVVAYRDYPVEADEPKRILWTFDILEGDSKGNKVFTLTVLTERALWKVNQLLRACGEVPQGTRLEPEKLIGKRLQIQVEDREYQGVPRTEAVRFFPEQP